MKMGLCNKAFFSQSILACNSIIGLCLACYMLSPVCLSVCPSVTQVDKSKTFEVRIIELSPQSSSIPLAFLWYKFNPEIPMGSPERGHKTRVGRGKQAIF